MRISEVEVSYYLNEIVNKAQLIQSIEQNQDYNDDKLLQQMVRKFKSQIEKYKYKIIKLLRYAENSNFEGM